MLPHCVLVTTQPLRLLRGAFALLLMVLLTGVPAEAVDGLRLTTPDAALPVKTDPGKSSPAVSILHPASAGIPVYRHSVSKVDPTAANNPAAKTYPGFRGANQLVIYTPQFGEKTGTNEFGAEAIVINRVVRRVECCNSDIPPDGMVISGHGAAGQWIKNNLHEGAEVDYDTDSQMLLVHMTPSVYLDEAKAALAKATEEPPDAQADRAVQQQYARFSAQATDCVQHLSDMIARFQPSETSSEPDSVPPAPRPQPDASSFMKQIATQAGRCRTLADQAFILTVKSEPDAFRGIWVRPVEKNPQKIDQTLAELKKLKINDIFLETYSQGKTIYPSQVMAAYGLTLQHQRFTGTDPLRTWLDLAHKRGIRVHAWVQIFFAGNAKENAEQFGPILHKYPQWANVQRSHICAATACQYPAPELLLSGAVKPTGANPGASTVEDGHYFLDPANPEVRVFLDKLLSELVSTYPVDGVNLDYIRYPASFPVKSASFFSSTWGYTPVARKAFRDLVYAEVLEKWQLQKPVPPPPTPSRSHKHGHHQKTKLAPKKPDAQPYDPIHLTPSSVLWPRWVAWRKEQVSTFVETESKKLKTLRPGLTMTAVIFPLSDPESEMKLQDWPKWVANGWLDALTPIGLYPTADGIYRDGLGLRTLVQDKVPIYAGIFAPYNRLSPADFVAQIDAARRAGLGGVVIFENSRLDATYRNALKAGPFRN